MTFDEIMAVYRGSNGDATKALYAQLEPRGHAGVVAMNLFRACKASERAKVYRGGGYRGMAYEKKQWSMDNLSFGLRSYGAALGISWGWNTDPVMKPDAPHRHILYISIPTGQVSFHTQGRGEGPDYTAPWDRAVGTAPARICKWIEAIFKGDPACLDPSNRLVPDLKLPEARSGGRATRSTRRGRAKASGSPPSATSSTPKLL